MVMRWRRHGWFSNVRVSALACVLACAGCGEDPSSLDTRHTTASGTSGSGTSGSDTTGSGTSGSDTTGSDTTGTTSTNDGSAADICVSTINRYRATKGLAPLARWSATEACADGQAVNDGSTNAAHGAFGTCGEIAQNECPGWPAPAATTIPKCLQAMWSEGPGGGHYEAMSSRIYTKVACGFGTAADGSIWAVQNFH
jgi:hypothetical protein